MTWKLRSIPKVAHFFWDDSPLSFLRWMTLRSFSTLNPDWDLVLHTCGGAQPSWNTSHNKQIASEDLRERLGEIARLEIRQEGDELSHLAGVQQSDILRNRYLSEEGGLWADMDILFYRPVTELLCNQEVYADGQSGLCIRGDWFPIGFMLASKGSPYFTAVHAHQMVLAKRGVGSSYQKFGTGVYKSVLRQGAHQHFPVDPVEVYQHSWGAHARIFKGEINLNAGVGIHWYGGSASAAVEEPHLTYDVWQKHPLSKVISVTA